MIDLGLFKIRTDIFLLILSVILLALQLFLCAKIKNRLLRLLPVLVLFTLTLVFTVLIFVFDGWDSVGFLMLAIWTALLLTVCGVAWLMWWLLIKLKRRK